MKRHTAIEIEKQITSYSIEDTQLFVLATDSAANITRAIKDIIKRLSIKVMIELAKVEEDAQKIAAKSSIEVFEQTAYKISCGKKIVVHQRPSILLF